MTVAKDILVNCPVSSITSLPAPFIARAGTLKPESSVGSEEEIARMAKEGKDSAFKENNADRIFIEDVSSSRTSGRLPVLGIDHPPTFKL